VALVEHFRRARRLGGVSARLERAILRLVAFGMWGVAASTGVQSVMRLASGDTAQPTLAGTVLAGVSMVVLTLLARRKATLGRAVHSAALVADSQLTAVGAALACITVLGTAGTTALGWSWLDPAAALLMSCALVAVGASVAKQSARPNASTARRRRG
jgi:divalent metal cation (Fe/Co/Zn/Cd) transporter